MLKGTGKTTSECIGLCKDYNFVARQYYGQCWCGDDDNYDKHGAADDCICEEETVGDWRNCVYEYKTSVKEPSQASPSITPELSYVVLLFIVSLWWKINVESTNIHSEYRPIACSKFIYLNNFNGMYHNEYTLVFGIIYDDYKNRISITFSRIKTNI